MSKKPTLATSVTSRDPKGLKATTIFTDAYDGLKLDDDRAQRLNESAEFSAGLKQLMIECSTPDRFKDEETNSNYVYPKEYKGPRPIIEQIAAIANVFDIDPTQALVYAKNLPELPERAEGWFAVPSLAALAKKHFPEVADPAEQYCRAVQLVHTKISDSRSFYNYREGGIIPTQLRLHTRTAQAFAQIAETQPGDILIIAAQLGLCHRGRSVQRAREVFMANEYGLGSLITGSIILTHPERLVRSEELDMDCSGDEFAPSTDGDWTCCPCFYFTDGQVWFDADRVGPAGRHFGSASGFLGSVAT